MSSLLVLVQYRNSGVFLWKPNLWCQVILGTFQNYGAGKSLCYHLIVNCVGVPNHGARIQTVIMHV